ncbi:hypothetical protein, partial [Escherichia coli]|uniref:hypothetical protein n=1 Tax=Escherichia coli TaxID=562 RepID=UPI002018ED8A
ENAHADALTPALSHREREKTLNGAKHANHHHRPTQAQLVLASELGHCSRRAGRLVAGRGNGPAHAD